MRGNNFPRHLSGQIVHPVRGGGGGNGVTMGM